MDAELVGRVLLLDGDAEGLYLKGLTSEQIADWRNRVQEVIDCVQDPVLRYEYTKQLQDIFENRSVR